MASGTAERVDTLARRHPEWEPWLALVRLAQGEIARAPWPVTLDARGEPGVPRLAGARLGVDRRTAERWVRRVLGAVTGDAAAVALARAAGARALDAVALLEACVNADRPALEAQASALAVAAHPLLAVAPLLAMPALHACRARLGAADPAWLRGFCPTCGAWPTLAEARGLDRSRRLRCARCGDDWPIPTLRCPYCGQTGHERLGGLVVGGSADTRRVDTCAACLGYVKTITTLMATPAADVVVEDTATVDLDLAALEHGYRRHEGPGHALQARLAPTGRSRRLLAWP